MLRREEAEKHEEKGNRQTDKATVYRSRAN